MNALLIDDERLAREELRDLLRAYPDVVIVGEASCVRTAGERCAGLRPEVVFLDIQMPEQDGFAFLAKLPPPIPEVIFVTAHDRHAVEAFTANALDYLLKPVEPERLTLAIARLRTRLAERRKSASPARNDGMLADTDTLFVRDGARCWFVPVEKIMLAECVGNYTRLHFNGQKAMLLSPLTTLAARLDPKRFVSASRSQLINLAFVARTEFSAEGQMSAALLDGTSISFSRRAGRTFRRERGLV